MSDQDFTLKQLRDQFKKQGKFYTPEALSQMVKDEVIEQLGHEPDEALDITCGRASLLRAFSDEVKKFGTDIDEEAIAWCNENVEGSFKVFNATEDVATLWEEKRFEAIVGNPPFSVKWDQKKNTHCAQYLACKKATGALAPASKADWAFMQTMLYFLEENGVCVTIGFPGMLYRGASEGKIRTWFVEQGYIHKVKTIPAKTFVDTAIQTCLIVMKKQPAKEIEFINTEDDVSKKVSIAEVLENGATLSPNTYAAKEIKREEIDSVALNEEANGHAVKNIMSAVKLSEMISYIDKNGELARQTVMLGLKAIHALSGELIEYLGDINMTIDRSAALDRISTSN